MTTTNRPSIDDLKKKQTDFGRHKPLEELLAEQGVKPLGSMDELVIPDLVGEDPEELLQVPRDIRANR
ncbi:MAG: hypothetical protein WEB00_14795 [Dehalococcoidia bacterium]